MSNWPPGPGWTRSWLSLTASSGSLANAFLVASTTESVEVGEDDHRLDARSVAIGEVALRLRRDFADEVAVLEQDRVVAFLELRRPGHVVVGRRLDQGEPDVGQVLHQLVDDVDVARGVGVERLVAERLVAGVVHAEHDRDDGRLVGLDVAGQPDVDRPAAAAADAVSAPSRVDEVDLGLGEPGDGERLGEGRVEALLGDAVAVEHDAVPILEGELILGLPP